MMTEQEKKKMHGKKKVEMVMHEFKEGKLKSGSGEKVKNRKQAIAIAMSEAKMSKNMKKKRKMGTSDGYMMA